MPDRDLRKWIAQLEAEGDLKRIKAKVDWDDEISQIIRKVYVQGGPALLFENIKGHEATWSKKLFTNGLGTRSRVNVMLGLPRDTSPQDTVETIRNRMKKPLEPVRVKTGPVKENIIKGEDVDLFQIPVPKWHPLDNGRLFPKRLPASIDTIVDCPCLMCPDNQRCDPSSVISPQNCERLTEWLRTISQGQPGVVGDS